MRTSRRYILLIYYEYIANVLDSDLLPPAVVRWATHKKQPCIASSVNKHCSKMSSKLFNNTRRQTNTVEQTHHKSGLLGKRLVLVQAVKM